MKNIRLSLSPVLSISVNQVSLFLVPCFLCWYSLQRRAAGQRSSELGSVEAGRCCSLHVSGRMASRKRHSGKQSESGAAAAGEQSERGATTASCSWPAGERCGSYGVAWGGTQIWFFTQSMGGRRFNPQLLQPATMPSLLLGARAVVVVSRDDGLGRFGI